MGGRSFLKRQFFGSLVLAAVLAVAMSVEARAGAPPRSSIWDDIARLNSGKVSLDRIGDGLGKFLIPEAQASGVKWEVRRVPWGTGSGAAGAIPGGLDTLYITDESDTNRTTAINGSAIAWEEIGQINAATLGNPFQAAVLIVTANTSNGAADSLYAVLEPCFGGNCARSVASLDGYTTTTTMPLVAGYGPVANYTWSGTPTSALQGPPTIVFYGPLKVDWDTPANMNPPGLPSFRFNVHGDVGGTAPKLSGCRFYIFAPWRAQP